jgi:hypothetical protein
MENEVLKKIDDQNKKLEEIYRSTEKTRKYFLWALIITLVTFILPLIALAFVLPFFLKSYLGSMAL